GDRRLHHSRGRENGRAGPYGSQSHLSIRFQGHGRERDRNIERPAAEGVQQPVMSRGTRRRIAIALLLGGGLLVSYPAVSGGVLWDIGSACGYICLILVVCLYLFPVRGDGLPQARLWGMPQHRSIGWWVLGAAVAHAVALLVAEPKTGHYL